MKVHFHEIFGLHCVFSESIDQMTTVSLEYKYRNCVNAMSLTVSLEYKYRNCVNAMSLTSFCTCSTIK